MSRIPPMLPGDLDPRRRALYDSIAGGPRSRGRQHFPLTEANGALRGPFNAMLLSPTLGASLQALGSTVRYETLLTDSAREIAILLVAAHWGSAFEQEAHEPIALAAGVSQSQVEQLRRGSIPVDLAPLDHTCAETAAALIAGDLSDEEWQRARDELGSGIVFELTTLVGYYALLALQLRVFRVG